jgi:hypothetical protein
MQNGKLTILDKQVQIGGLPASALGKQRKAEALGREGGLDMFTSDALTTLCAVPTLETNPRPAAAVPRDRVADWRGAWRTTPEMQEQAVRCRIAQRTWGRLRQLHVEVDADHVIVRGTSPTYYLKQLALSAIQEMLPGTAVNLEIEVATSALPWSAPSSRQAPRIG